MPALETGRFCWCDIGSKNLEVSKKFYNKIFHWKFLDEEPTGASYRQTVWKVLDFPTGGFCGEGKVFDVAKREGHWINYVAVDCYADFEKKALALGAQKLDGEIGQANTRQSGYLLDPTGALFAMKEESSVSTNAFAQYAHGNPGWRELITTDTKRAAEFYSELFDYDTVAYELGDGSSYYEFKLSNRSIAGMVERPQDWDVLSNHWLTYLNVDNYDAAEKIIQDQGGVLLRPSQVIADIGKFSFFKDPCNSVFGIIQFMKTF